MQLKHFVVAVLCTLLLSRCESLVIHPLTQLNKDWVDLEQWDQDANESLDLGEFVQGYDNAAFFKKWDEKLNPISDSVFLFRTFGLLDRNDNYALDSTEYNSRRILWSFRGTLQLEKWDKDCDKVLDHDEFMDNAKKENLVYNFDLTSDGQITETEMAQAMFEVCDKDDDGQVGGIEFYLWEVYRR